MLHSVKDLQDFQLAALDGALGKVEELYFDDQGWATRYLVVKTGSWMASRKVLVSPAAVTEIDWEQEVVHVKLNREQVRHSPLIDADKPVSRQQEEQFALYYGYYPYWNQPYMWGENALPGIFEHPDVDTITAEMKQESDRYTDAHLRSTRAVSGYAIQTTDDTIGRVEDFLFEDRHWTIPLLVVETRDWWPGKHVLIASKRVERIDWESQCLAVSVTRDELEHNPDYDLMSAIPGGAVQELYRRFWRSPYSP